MLWTGWLANIRFDTESCALKNRRQFRRGLFRRNYA
jgi:hypothetical protein